VPDRYSDLHRHWLQLPQLPSLYLHGRTDGCMSPAFARWVDQALPDGSAVAGQLPAQMLRSWYIGYFQLPWLPDRSASWVLPRLWRRWSPGYPADEDLRHVDAAIGTPEGWRAALGPYRALRSARVPDRYAELHRHWLQLPRLSSLYLHGRTDGCMSPAFTRWVEQALPDGSAVAVVEHAGHFLQLEQPDEVADRVLTFIT
jgi:pimeloyl-ACP methyl ester carboxylesterase